MEKQILEELGDLEKYEGPPKYCCRELTNEEGYAILPYYLLDEEDRVQICPSIIAGIVMPGEETGIIFLPQRFVDQLTNYQIEWFNQGGFKLKCAGMTSRSINLQLFI